MSRSRFVAQIVLAIAGGLLASVAVARYYTAEPPAKPAVKVLIAKQHIGAFTKLQRDQFETREMAEDQVQNWMREDDFKAHAEGKPIKTAIRPGMPLSEDALYRREDGGFLEALRPGEVAAAVRVNLDSAVAGFVQPGYRVDVEAVTARPSGEAMRPFAQIILQDVEVLATNGDIERGETPSRTFDRVTLRLNRADAEMLGAFQEASSSLRLLLRGRKDIGMKYDDKGSFAERPGERLAQRQPNAEPPDPFIPPVIISPIINNGANSNQGAQPAPIPFELHVIEPTGVRSYDFDLSKTQKIKKAPAIID